MTEYLNVILITFVVYLCFFTVNPKSLRLYFL
nr:MAG TPA: hypothetical protein [Caudoviricetes sp.]